MRRIFAKIAVVDFEYEIDDGDLPRVLCMVIYRLDKNLQRVKAIRVWRGEFGKVSPFDDDTLFVAYSAWAEMTCFMTLGWKFPKAHLRSPHSLSGRKQHPAAVRSQQQAEARA